MTRLDFAPCSQSIHIAAHGQPHVPGMLQTKTLVMTEAGSRPVKEAPEGHSAAPADDVLHSSVPVTVSGGDVVHALHVIAGGSGTSSAGPPMNVPTIQQHHAGAPDFTVPDRDSIVDGSGSLTLLSRRN